jgi:DNA-binding response OmpR family regulator
LVEDDNDILDLFCDCLQSAGYKITPFNNPVEALNYFNKNYDENTLANCSLVITDYRMPHISGIDFIKKIREKDTDCKIRMMLISAFMKSDLNVNVILNNLKIDKIIEKPIHLETLKHEVKKLIVN